MDLADRGLVCRRSCYLKGLTDDPRCRTRPGVADALERARDLLPAGFNFLISDAWRPWSVQEQLARCSRLSICSAHPDWTEEEVNRELVRLAPPIYVVFSFNRHRYGGALDLTILDADGRELDMGTPLPYLEGPEAALLHFELQDRDPAHETPRKNRRLLIQVMSAAGFTPYLPEWWHWEYDRDFHDAGCTIGRH